MSAHDPPQFRPPDAINPRLQLASRTAGPIDIAAWYARIRQGDRVALARAITLIESQAPEHQALAQRLIQLALPDSGRALRIGITGSPGVGKSTFIEAFGLHLIEQGYRPAVLAVDPSSQRSKGSILGDKTRMEQLTRQQAAFIRPSPAGNSLGGVARMTRETIWLCEAAGYNIILVETVGVGQSETAVHSMTDLFLLLLLPGAGDELQGIKRGIVEMADLLAINKADQGRESLAQLARRAYRTALHLFPPKPSGWTPEVHTCSAATGQGISFIADRVLAYRQQLTDTGYWQTQRAEQSRFWLRDTIERRLRDDFFRHPAVLAAYTAVEAAVMHGELTPFAGAEQLLSLRK